MAKTSVIQHAFNRGEIDPALVGRTDWQPLFSGVRRGVNVICRPQGGLVKKPGSRYVAPSLTQDRPPRFIKFEYSANQAYMLEFGHYQFRILHNQALVVYPAGHPQAGQVVVLPSPYSIDQVNSKDLQADAGKRIVDYCQKNDVIIFTHPDVPPQILARHDHHVWVWSQFETGTSIATPQRLRITRDGRNGARYVVAALTAANEQSLTSNAVNCTDGGNSLPMPDTANLTAQMCRNLWTSYGLEWPYEWDWGRFWNDQYEIAFNILRDMFGYYDLRQSSGTQYATRPGGQVISWYAENVNNAGIQARNEANYAINTNWGNTSPLLNDMRNRIRQYVENYNAQNAVTGNTDLQWDPVAGAAYYRVYRLSVTNDVSRFYSIGDTTGTTFNDNNLPFISPSQNPQESNNPFSDPDDWPAVCTFHKGRLLLACSNNEPDVVWGSRLGEYRNFNKDTGTPTAENTFKWAVDGSKKTPIIMWMESMSDVLMGTSAGEYRMTGDQPAYDPGFERQSDYGNSQVKPKVMGRSIITVGNNRRVIHAYSFDNLDAAYKGKALSHYAEHLFEEKQIEHLAGQSDPLSLIWAVFSDGTMASITHVAEEEVLGITRHETDGMYEVVESLTVTGGKTEIWMVVARTFNGQTMRTIEVMADMHYPASPPEDAWYVDCGLDYRGDPKTTLSGLGHLEGREVVCWGDAEVFTGLTVVGGTVTLPRAVSRAIIGLPYTSLVETLEMEVAGQPIAHLVKQPETASILFYHTREASISCGGSKPRNINFLDKGGLAPTAKTIRKSVSVPPPPGGDTNSLTIFSALPVPFGLLAMTVEVSVGATSNSFGRAFGG